MIALSLSHTHARAHTRTHRFWEQIARGGTGLDYYVSENRDIFQCAIITPQMQPDRWTMSQACHLNYSHVAVGTFDGWKAVLPKHVAP